jgi:hypothetical protein
MQADGAGVNMGTENTGVEVGAAGGRHGGLADGYGVDAVPPIEHAGTCSLLPHPPESALPWGRREIRAYGLPRWLSRHAPWQAERERRAQVPAGEQRGQRRWRKKVEIFFN